MGTKALSGDDHQLDGQSTYRPNKGHQVALDFRDEYAPPSGYAVPLEFVPADGDEGDAQYLFPTGYDACAFGDSYIKRATEWVSPEPIRSPDISDEHEALLYTRYLNPRAINAPTIQNPRVWNWNFDAEPKGFVAYRTGNAYIWNLLQIRSIRGFSASFYGRPFVVGGVKYVEPKGQSHLRVGTATVINSMADQFASPKGIAPPKLGAVNVSPRMLYALGIYGTAYSEPVVQFPPFPVGWLSSSTGTPVIDHRTKFARPKGLDSGERIGYPVVRDLAQRILTPSIIGAGIFGDTRIQNRSFIVRVDGFYSFEDSRFSEVRSNRRAVESSSFDSQLHGDASVRNKTPSFAPAGFDSSALGLPSVGYHIRYLYGRGFHDIGYGRAVLTQTPSIAPKGFTGEVGEPNIWPAIRAVYANGKDSQEIGVHIAWFSLRATLLDGFEASLYGKPKLEHSRREILADGKLRDGYGRPRISTLNRSIEPEGIFYEFPVVHTVGGLRFMNAFGFVATKFGSRIIPERQTAYPQGFANAYGLASVENFTKVVPIAGFSTGVQEADRWGRAKFFNLSQYIAMYFDPDSGLNPPAWPIWTLIENRTKNFRVSGHNSQLFGNAIIFNNARPVSFKGIAPPDLPDYYEAGMVAYRIRRLPLEGLEAPYLSSWSRVYNDAFVIRPSGYRADVYGDANLKNTRRYFNRIGGFKTEQTGAPMIAYRIREIEFEARYSIAPPRIQLHVVDLYTRYVECAGEDYSKVGWSFLQIVFRKITPRWTHRDYFGWANLWNVTPMLRTRGRASDEFGDSLVRLEWRPVEPDGSNMQLFGLTTIADRDRSLSVNGLRAWAFGDKLRVIRLGQPPYTEQYIDLGAINEESEDGFGIWPTGGDRRNIQVPSPALNQYVIYAQGFTADKYGSAHLQSNALIVDSGINDSANGEPVITMMLRSIHVPEGESPLEPSKARVSPHTIWAKPAPEQATINHPESSAFYPVGQVQGARFGQTRISTWRGEIYTRSGFSSSRVGAPRLHLHRRYISPEAIAAYRNGWQSIDGGYRYVNQLDSSVFTEFGRAVIAPAPYTGPQHIRAGNINSMQFGWHVSEPLHRAYRLTGFNSLQMGLVANPNRPYMWQGLRIGPLMPTIPVGDDMSAWGDTWVSHRVREVCTEGFDTFVSEYELENFRERLKVELAKKPRPPNQYMAPVGMEVSAVSVPNVRLGVHYILPDGNADQYRKGAPN